MDEKRIKVSIDGDASGLNDEIERVSSRGADAFKELGFDEIFDEAADKFEKRIEQFEYVLKELKKDKDETNKIYDERVKGTTNQAGANRVEQERNERLKNLTKAIEALHKAMDAHNKKVGKGEVDEKGNKVDNKDSPCEEKRNASEPEDVKHERLGRGMGRGFTQLLQGNWRGGFRSIFGGGGGGGAAAEGEAAGGMGGGMGGAATKAGLLALAYLGMKAFKAGSEDLRADNRLRAMGAGRDVGGQGYDYGEYRSIGIDKTDAKKMMLDNMQSAVGLGLGNKSTVYNNDSLKKEIFDYTLKRQRFETAYGLQSNTQQGLDPFLRTNKQDPNQIIAEMMIRNQKSITSEGGTFLGSLANEKLGQIVKLMELQKSNSERTDSRLAMSLIAAGNRIGGQFADDRGGEKMGDLVGGLSNPKGDMMKALMFGILSKKYGSLSDTMGAIEGIGSNSEDMRMVTSGMGSRFGSGEIAKLMFGSQMGTNGNALFQKQNDANKFFNKGGFNTITGAIDEGDASLSSLPGKVNKIMDTLQERAENLTLNTDALQVAAKNVSITTGRVLNQMATNEAGLINENEVK